MALFDEWCVWTAGQATDDNGGQPFQSTADSTISDACLSKTNCFEYLMASQLHHFPVSFPRYSYGS